MNQANMSAKEIFRAAVKGNNFMTPDLIRYEMVADHTAVELSYGYGFSSEPIFGVTGASLEERDGRIEFVRRDEINRLCHSRKEAEDYIAELKSKLLAPRS